MRIGFGKRIGSFYIGASTSTKGCGTALLSVFLLPFYLTYFVCIWPFIKLYQIIKKQSAGQGSSINKSVRTEYHPVEYSPAVSTGTQKKAELIKEDFVVAGVSYYKENIMKLACSNPDWRKHAKTLLAENKHTVYRYNFIYKPVKLILEPSNEHDPNAILVQIAGEKVGYISCEENIHVRDILENRSVKYISAFVFGGDYKVISDAGLMDKGTQEVGINIRIAYS